MTEQKKFNIVPYLFIFLATFLTLQLFSGGQVADPALEDGEFGIKTLKNKYTVGKDIQFEVKNNTLAPITLYTSYEDSCDGLMFGLEQYTSNGFINAIDSADGSEVCENEAEVFLELAPGDKEKISLADYSYTYFGDPGRYRISFFGAENTYLSPEFEVKEPGFITKAWRTILYQPILNALIALIIWTPGHSLALSIIILTMIIRTILLVPSQKSFDSQRKMQEIQPKIEKVKRKYKDDQARIAQETMKVWKDGNVHPASSCVPLLIQFPILIALFYVVQNGLSPDQAELIYEFMPDFVHADMNTNFLGFDILQRSLVVFPLAIGILQFGQMQILMAKKKTDDKKTSNKKSKKAKKEVKKAGSMPKEMEQANKMMKYMMPIMIAGFATQMPAAVSLYWGTSTLYGIIQQLVLKNRRPVTSGNDKEDVKIRVINKQHGKTN